MESSEKIALFAFRYPCCLPRRRLLLTLSDRRASGKIIVGFRSRFFSRLFFFSTFAVLSEGRLHCNKLSMVKPIGQNEYDYCTVGRTGSLYFNWRGYLKKITWLFWFMGCWFFSMEECEGKKNWYHFHIFTFVLNFNAEFYPGFNGFIYNRLVSAVLPY